MVIYTDGSCRDNGNPNASGGFGVVVIDEENNKVFTYAHQENGTTNNRQEMKAVLYAIIHYGSQTDPPEVFCDSSYVVNTFQDWMFKWKRNGWTKSNGERPENLGLVKIYYDLFSDGYKINLKKIAGHAGNFWNDIADGLATGKIKPSNTWEDLSEYVASRNKRRS